MITLHCTDNEMNDLSAAEGVCAALRQTGESPVAMPAHWWPAQRLPTRAYLYMPSIVQCVERTMLWCDMKGNDATD